MNGIDALILSIKRRDTPLARMAYDAYRRLEAFDVPDNEAMRLLFGGAFVAQRVAPTLASGPRRSSCTRRCSAHAANGRGRGSA